MKSEAKIRVALPEGLNAEALRDMYFYMALTRLCDDRAFALNRSPLPPPAKATKPRKSVRPLPSGAAWIGYSPTIATPRWRSPRE